MLVCLYVCVLDYFCLYACLCVAADDVSIVNGLISCRNLRYNFITMISADAFTDLPQLQTLFVLCACGCLCVRDCACVCMSAYECIVWHCEIGLMSCRDLDSNRITMIPANAFTNLTQLQTLFVLCKWVPVSVCVCACLCVSVLCGFLRLD